MLAASMSRALVASRRGSGSAICSPLLRHRSRSSTSTSSKGQQQEEEEGSTEVLLLRDYISRRLTGYFSAPAASSPVGELARALQEKEDTMRRGENGKTPPSSIDFPSLSGRSSYEHALSDLYRRLSVSWLTPSELFSPHYGRAVARFVAEDAKARTKLSSRKEGEGEGEEIRVVEVGAGRDTLAADFLDYLAEAEPALHRRTRYVSLEVSPSLARAQEEKVRSRSGSGSGSSRGEGLSFSSVVGDASDPGAWRRAAAEVFRDTKGQEGKQQQHLYVLAFEVLDNLPHDRVVSETSFEEEVDEEGDQEGRRKETKKQSWLQTFVEVEKGTGRPLKELLGPVSDPLISLCLSASQKWQEKSGKGGAGSSSSSSSSVARFFDAMFSFVGGGSKSGRGEPASAFADRSISIDDEEEGEIVFLPTGAASMLSSLFEVAPDHTLLAADFDALPGVAVPGANAPLVSSTRGGVARDFGSLYSPPVGEAVDIFFPTKFEALSELYEECAGRKRRRRSKEEEEEDDVDVDDDDEEEGNDPPPSARHCKQSSFLSLAADTAAFSRGAVSTASGWSPMLDDWTNTAVLVARSKKKKRRSKEEGGGGGERRESEEMKNE